MRIKKNDTVYIRTGSDKGKTGRVLFVIPKKNRVVVEGINMKKRHQRPSQKSPKGGIITIEGPIHISNVAIYNSAQNRPTKTSTKVIVDGGKKQRLRIDRKTGEQI